MRSRDRRAIMAGAAVIVVAWLAFRVAPDALAAVRQMDAELEQRTDLLNRARARVQGSHALADSIAALEALAASVPRMVLAGRDVETASVDLMRRVTEVGQRYGRFERFEGRAAGPRAGPLERVELEATFETDFPGVMKLVRDIEADSVLSIEALDITARDPHASDDDPERLAVRMRIAGWHQSSDVSRRDGGAR